MNGEVHRDRSGRMTGTSAEATDPPGPIEKGTAMIAHRASAKAEGRNVRGAALGRKEQGARDHRARRIAGHNAHGARDHHVRSAAIAVHPNAFRAQGTAESAARSNGP